jgi:hypothetical protein
MGFLDFFTGGSPQKQIDGIKRRLMDAFRQSDERYECMDKLAKIGSSEALDALLARFTLRVSGPTVDEEEKAYAYKLIPRWGEAAIEPLKKFIATHDAVYFPLKSLRELAGDDVAVEALMQAMDGTDPGYHEGLERLREIVSNLRDFQHPRVRDALVALLASRSNEIRFFALDGLAGYPSEEIAGHFAARLLDPDESQRVKQLAMELLVDKQVSMAQWAAVLTPVMPPMYRLDAEGVVQRK